VKSAKVFYGWWVVGAAALGLFLSTGSIVVLTFGVFFKAFAQSFHASRGAISLAFTLQALASAVSIPLIGRLVDRFGARSVILAGTAMFALMLMGSEALGAHIASFYVFFVALGAIGGCTSPVGYGVVVSHWFDRRRGLALGCMALGLGLGTIVMPLVAHAIIERFGWRAAYAVFGCAVLIALPIVGTLLVNDPAVKGLRPDGASSPYGREASVAPATVNVEGLSWHRIWHERTFWLMLSAFFLAGASVFGFTVHMPALLTDRGVSAQGSAAAASFVGIGLLLGRFGAGYLLDRFFAPFLAGIFFGGSAIGIALLFVVNTTPGALVAAFLVGTGMGAEVDIIAYLTSRYFGMRALGTAFAVSFAGYVLAGAFGVLAIGATFDLAHSYTLPLAACFAAMLGAVAIIIRLGPYRFGASSAPGSAEQLTANP
jgi:MFS family permease